MAVAGLMRLSAAMRPVAAVGLAAGIAASARADSLIDHVFPAACDPVATTGDESGSAGLRLMPTLECIAPLVGLFAALATVVVAIALALALVRSGRLRRDSELRALRHRADEATRADTVSTMVLSLADEFADLLTTIRSGLAQAAGSPGLTTDARTAVDDAIAASGRGIAITRRLSGIAAARPDVIEHLDLAEVVRSLAPVIEATVPKSVRLVTTVSPGTKPVDASRIQLETAILMMLRHACSGLADGGTLDLRLTGGPGAAGPRIEMESQGDGTLHRPRPRTYVEATARIDAVAQSAGGRIEHRTTLDGLRIDLVFDPEAEMPDGAPVALHGAHILLIDGDDGARRAIARMLRQMNHDVTEMPSADAALARLSARAGFDAAIVAVALPGILQGHDFVRALADMDPDLPVLLTGTRPDRDHPRILTKPLSPADLDRALRPILAARGRGSPLRDLTSG